MFLWLENYNFIGTSLEKTGMKSLLWMLITHVFYYQSSNNCNADHAPNTPLRVLRFTKNGTIKAYLTVLSLKRCPLNNRTYCTWQYTLWFPHRTEKIHNQNVSWKTNILYNRIFVNWTTVCWEHTDYLASSWCFFICTSSFSKLENCNF